MMDTWQKLATLAEDSRYDLACACATDPREHRRRKVDGTWLYPVPLASGGYGVMLKTLLSNACSSDCRYCPLRCDGISERCSLTPDETARIFMEHLKKQWLLGIFLSSGIIGTADRTMERLTATAELLRKKYRYRGYIHLKIIPGASEAAIHRALQLASAVSLNIEAPGERYFSRLSSYKQFDRDIVRPLKYIAGETAPGNQFARIKCTTQFIVGAAGENDRDIMRYTSAIYERLRFKRVYFSAYQPPPGGLAEPDTRSEFILSNNERLTREHRLYQADFLLRQYHFQKEELLFDRDGNFDLTRDPKRAWADAHPEEFPIRINHADREMLLRIPGIGPIYAARIVRQRRSARISTLETIGLRGKAAQEAQKYIDFC